VKISEWDLGLSSREVDDLKEVLPLVKVLKDRGVTRGSAATTFCLRLSRSRTVFIPHMSTGGNQTHSFSELQGLQGGDGGQSVPDLLWEIEDQEVPEGTLAEEAY
jgi:hypothetical protein